MSNNIAAVSSEDDARLIAAAPELLEALQALREADKRNQYRSWEIGVPDYVTARRLAESAIAKATGEKV